MWWNDHNMGSSDWVTMTFAMVAFWSLFVVVVFAIRKNWTARPPGEEFAGRTPVQTLDDRFARGEIDADEYQTRREILRAGR